MKNISIVILSFIAIIFFVIGNWELPTSKYYSCRDLEFHPDVPPQVKTECRKLIREQLEEERKRTSDTTGYIT
jgi:hypothetical protein